MVKTIENLTVKNMRISPVGRQRLKAMLFDIYSNGRTNMCPRWTMYITNLEKSDISRTGCEICQHFFPKLVIDTHCPCFIIPKNKIIMFLRAIVNNNKPNT